MLGWSRSQAANLKLGTSELLRLALLMGVTPNDVLEVTERPKLLRHFQTLPATGGPTRRRASGGVT